MRISPTNDQPPRGSLSTRNALIRDYSPQGPALHKVFQEDRSPRGLLSKRFALHEVPLSTRIALHEDCSLHSPLWGLVVPRLQKFCSARVRKPQGFLQGSISTAWSPQPGLHSLASTASTASTAWPPQPGISRPAGSLQDSLQDAHSKVCFSRGPPRQATYSEDCSLHSPSRLRIRFALHRVGSPSPMTLAPSEARPLRRLA